MLQSLHQPAHNFGYRLEQRLGLRVINAPNICPAFLLRLLQQGCDVLRMFFGRHACFGLLHVLALLFMR